MSPGLKTLIAGAALLLCLATKGGASVLPHMPAADPNAVVTDARRETWETRVSLACLQGIVNRTRPRLYVVWSDSDETWLRWIRERHYVRTVTNLTVPELLERFRPDIKGAVLYDPALPVTINIASMEASLRQGVLASSETASAWKLPVLEDLRGRWKTADEALKWSLKNLKPKMNPRLLATIYPGANSQSIRDYAVAARAFTFWCGDKPEFGEVMAAFPANSPLIGYWGYGDASKPDYPGLTEYDALLIFSKTGKFSTGSEFSSNWSYLSGLRVSEKAFQRKTLPPPNLKPNKVYLAISIVESGDALWYWQSRQREVWEDKNLGAVPVGWCLNPTAFDVIPAVLEWYYHRAPANQEFFCALSGAGYFSAPDFASGLPDANGVWQGQADLLRPYLRTLSLRGAGMWMGPWRVPDDYRRVLSQYVSRMPELSYLLPDMGRADNIPDNEASYLLGHCAVFHTRTRWRIGPPATQEEEIDWLVNDIRAHTPTRRPAFVSAMAYSWTHSPTTIQKVAERLGPGYVCVTPGQLAALLVKAKVR